MKKFISILSITILILISSISLTGCTKCQNLTASMVSLSQNSYVFDGTEKKPDVKVTTSKEVINQENYTILYSDNVNAGQASVTVVANEKNKKISGSVTVHFSIEKKQLGKIGNIENTVFSGNSKKPNIVIEDAILDQDYNLSYEYREIGGSSYKTISKDDFIDAGEYKITATGINNYTGTSTVYYTISKADYSNVSVSREDYIFGQNSNINISKNVDGEIKYYLVENNVEFTKTTNLDVGEYLAFAKILESKNYNEFKTENFTFNVSKFDISNLTISFEKENYNYTGLEICPNFSISYNSNVLKGNEDYDFSYSNNIRVGKGRLQVNGKGNYTGSIFAEFEIKTSETPCIKHTDIDPIKENFIKATTEKDGSYDLVVYCEVCGEERSREKIIIPKIDTNVISLSENEFTYSGEEFTPIVTAGDYKVDVDYTVTYENNINAGTAFVNITFIGNYDAIIKKEFTIKKIQIVEPSIDGIYIYNGTSQTANILNDNKLFSVSGNSQINAGTHKILVSLIDNVNYEWKNRKDSNDFELDFIIECLSIENCSVDFVDNSLIPFTYNGNAFEPSVNVTMGEINLINGNDYNVSYTNNVNAGAGIVKITGKNNYSGEVEKAFSILAQKVKKPEIIGEYVYSGKEITANLSNTSTLFKVSNSTQLNSGEYTVLVELNDKNNYVWETDTNEVLQLNFVIKKLKIQKPSKKGTYVYSGDEQEFIFDNLSEVLDIFGNKQTDAGSYDVTIALPDITNYEWEDGSNESLKINFVINSADISNLKLKFKEENFEYSGKEINAEFDLYFNEKLLISDKDYIVEYLDNKNVGIAKVTVTGKGNYTGKINDSFTIGLKKVTAPSVNESKVYNYNGEMQYVELLNTEDENLYTVTGNCQTNAGNYTIIVSLNNTENYIWNETKNNENLELKFVINKKEVITPSLDKNEFIYSGEKICPQIINDIDCEFYTIDNINALNAGNYSILISLNSPTNYMWGDTKESEPIKLDFKINKAKIKEPTLENDTYIFTGKDEIVQLTYNDNNSSKLKVSGNIYKDSKNYTIFVEIDNDYKNNFEWENSQSEILSFDYSVQKKNIEELDISIESKTFTYSGQSIKPVVTIKYGDITLRENIDYTLEFSNNTFVSKNATIKILSKEDSNYSGNKEITFEIEPKIVSKPYLLENEFTYTGSEIEAKLNYNNSLLFEISNSTNKQIDAGNYFFTISLKDKQNYVWENSSNINDIEDILFEFTINKKIVEIPKIDKINSFEYTGAEIEVKLSNDGGKDFYTIYGNNHKDVGEYYLTISLKNIDEKINYIWENGKYDDIKIGYKITPKAVKNPSIDGTYYYNGKEQTINLLNLSDLFEIIEGSNKKTQSGEYYLKFGLKDKQNYVWENSKTAEDIKLQFRINKVDVSVSLVNCSNYDFVYNEGELEANVLTVEIDDRTLIFDEDYSANYSYDMDSRLVTIVVTGKNNYYGSKTLYSTLESKNIYNENIELSSTFEIYNGTNLMPSVTIRYDDFILEIDKDYRLNWLYNGQCVDEIVNAGTYYLSIENLSYYSVNQSKTFVVKKCNYENIKVEKEDYFYGNNSSIGLNASVYGNVDYYYTTDLDKEEKIFNNSDNYDVGTYYVYAVILESDNYNEFTTEVTEFKVSKATRSNITISKDGYSFGNETETYIYGYDDTNYTMWYYKDNETIDDSVEFYNDTIFNVGTYYIYAIIEKTAYYNEYSTPITSFTVTPGDYKDVITVSRESYIYNESKTETIVSNYSDEMSFVKFYYNGINASTGGTEYVDTDNINSGIYYIYAVIESHGNYKKYTTETSMFTIEKVTYLDMNVITSDYIYGESSVSLELSNEVFENADVKYYITDTFTNESGMLITEQEYKPNAGTYYIFAIIDETQNYNSYTTTPVKIEIKKVTVKEPSVSDKIYSGFEYEFIKENDYFIVENGIATNANDYDVTVRLKDSNNYAWENNPDKSELIFKVKIAKASFENINTVLSQTEFTYDGNEKIPTVSNYLGELKLPEKEYTVSYLNNKNAGTAKVIIEANQNGNFEGQKEIEFCILKADYENISVLTPYNEYTYTSKVSVDISSSVYGKVTYYYNLINSNEGGTEFNELKIFDANTYYIFAVIDEDENKEESKNYNKYITETISFTVSKVNFDLIEIAIGGNEYRYTGNEVKPQLNPIIFNGYELKENIDFTVEYKNNINCGEASIVIRAVENGNFIGEKTINFDIKNLSFDDLVVQFKDDIISFNYKGSPITPEIIVRLGGQILVLGNDYNIEYSSNTNIGQATIKVIGIGDYAEEIKYVYFTITGISLENAQINFSGATYGDSVDKIENNIEVKVNDNIVSRKNNENNDNYTIEWYFNDEKIDFPINAGTYKIKICASENGNYSGESKKIEVSIKSKTARKTDFNLNVSEIQWTGENLISQIVVTYKGENLSASDYKIVWNYNNEETVEIKDKGIYTATIQVKGGNYTCAYTISRELEVV